jgi:predicted ATP-grasp superfamily ATP-dependent carboligase
MISMGTLTPNILIHEYISGGGWPGRELPKSLAAEGLSMLRAVLADFKAWGGANIITTCDRRLGDICLGDIPLPAERIIYLDPSDHYNTLEQLAKRCQAALIIAPESDGILERLSALMEFHGVRLLGSSSDSIAIAANKWTCHQLFLQAGLSMPATWRVDVREAEKTAERIGYPLVMKPLDGIGCEGVNLVRSTASLLLALEKYQYNENQLLLQRYIEGEHISASLLISENKISCASLNMQTIEIGAPFRYHGCEVPYIGAKEAEAVSLAKHAAALIPGLRGYVGVDMLINGEGCYIIEINPRLTTSYTALRQVININMAESIWRASMEGSLPQEYILSGKVIVNKEDWV